MPKKKKWLVGILAAGLLLLCCIPIKLTYKDGGTVKYQAVLWSYTRYHSIEGIDGNGKTIFYEGTEFRLFPFNFLSKKDKVYLK